MDHDALFDDYVTELRQAKAEAEQWWCELLKDEIRMKGNRETAMADLRSRWPFGPASHPWIIAVFRKFYILCDRLNDELDNLADPSDDAHTPDDWGTDDDLEVAVVPPRTFVIDWLSSPPNRDLYRFLLSMVYIPIGFQDDKAV